MDKLEYVAKSLDMVYTSISKPKNAEAYANLISAAPDMYEALKFVKPYIAKMIADNVNTAIPPQRAYDVIEIALAKAEGE